MNSSQRGIMLVALCLAIGLSLLAVGSAAGATVAATNQAPFLATIRFSEPVQGFDANALKLANGRVVRVVAQDPEYKVWIMPRAQGLVSLEVPRGLVRDGAGNVNAEAVSRCWQFDNQTPVVTLSALPGPAPRGTVPVRVAFSEDVCGLSLSSLQTARLTALRVQTNSLRLFTVWVRPDGARGGLVSVPANVAFDAAGNGNQASSALPIALRLEPGLNGAACSDLDGDGRSDVMLFSANDQRWILAASASDATPAVFAWGVPGAIPLAGDFDGDRRVDLAFYEPAHHQWQARSMAGDVLLCGRVLGAGAASGIPLAGDLNGDGLADPALFDPASGRFDQRLDGAVKTVETGCAGLPVTGDFNGDGVSECSAYDARSGLWTVLASDGTPAFALSLPSNSVPAPGDYDGDGISDPAVFDAASGLWTVCRSSLGYVATTLDFGDSACVPMPGDYDGDRVTDVAVYRESDGLWLALESGSGQRVSRRLGGPGYAPANVAR